MHCPECRSVASTGAKFCSECGSSLQGSLVGRATLEAQFAVRRSELPDSLYAGAAAPTEDETRPLTILFADMSSSVAKTHALDPEETAELIDRVLRVMVDAILAQDGRINSFLGDGVLAFFGTPRAHEDDAERAILCALAIRDGLRGLGLDATAGIDSGEVYLGRVGSEQHQEFAARGLPINLAARLQASAGPGEILVGDPTYRLARRSFEFVARDLEVKGVTEPLLVYEVVGALPRREKPRGIEGLRAELHGREEELARLHEALARLGQGHGGIATVVGEAGVGKSRLVEEAKQLGGGGVHWLEGRCLESGTATSYLPYIDILRELFGWTPQDDDRARERRIRATVERLAANGALAPERTRELVPLLGNILSIQLSDESASGIASLGPEQLKNRTFIAVRDLLVALAREGPVAVVFEDLHWADSLSLDLLSVLMDASAEAPILLVCVSRAEPEHRWQRLRTLAAQKGGSRYAEVTLRELGIDESGSLLRALLHIDRLPAEMEALILSRAQGNPFFLEEVLRSLIDTGAVAREGDRWRARAEIVSFVVPESVQSVIVSRVDRLDDDSRRALQTASVLGRSFRRSLLAHMTGNGDELERALWELERRELLYEDRVIPEEEYSFKHVLTQETIYRSLLRRRRTALHDGAVDALEALYSGGLEEHYEQLAHHAERGTDARKAIDYLQLAGEKARRAYLNEAALDYLGRARRRLEGLEEVDETWRRRMSESIDESRGDLLELTGRHDEAIAAYESALESLASNELVARARVRRKTAVTRMVQRRVDEARAGFDAAQGELGPEPENATPDWSQEWVEIQLDRALLLYFNAPVEEVLAATAEAAPVVQRRGTLRQRGRSMQMLYLAALRRDVYVADDQTIDYARQSLALLEEADALDQIGISRFGLGFCLLWANRIDEAEVELERTLELAERTGDVTLAARCLTYLTMVARKRTDVDRAASWAARSLAVAEAGQLDEYVIQARANRAWIAWREGDIEELEHEANAARGWFTHPAGPYHVLHWVLAWPVVGLAFLRGDVAEAAERALALLEPGRQPMPAELEDAVRQIADADNVEAAIARALEVAKRSGYA